MSAIDDGGPVYPTPEKPKRFVGGVWLDNSGMTLRDWFAGQALAGILANQNTTGVLIEVKKEGASPTHFMARMAYEMADAMLAARKGGTND